MTYVTTSNDLQKLPIGCLMNISAEKCSADVFFKMCHDFA